MRSRFSSILILQVGLFLTTNAIAQDTTPFSVDPKVYPHPTAIWKIENPATGHHFFLGGTTHRLDDSDFPLPSPYYGIYEAADVLVFEILREPQEVDHAALRGWVARNKSHLRYPRGESLETHLSTDTKQLLRKTYGTRYASKLKKPPLRLAFERMRENSDRLGGIDDLFRNRAREEKKPLRRLDEPSDSNPVLETLDALSDSIRKQVEENGIDAVVHDLLQTGDGMGEPSLFASYRDGNLPKMEAILAAKQRADPENFQQAIQVRNKRWMKKLSPMLQSDSPEVEFILVGAAHIAGESGLLQLLAAEGFSASQVYGFDPKR